MEKKVIKYHLLKDVTSGKRIVYGKKGEVVIEVSVNGNVVIVESVKTKERFAASISDLAKIE